MDENLTLPNYDECEQYFEIGTNVKIKWLLSQLQGSYSHGKSGKKCGFCQKSAKFMESRGAFFQSGKN